MRYPTDDLPSARECLTLLGENRTKLYRSMRSLHEECSLRGRLANFLKHRESNLPGLIREAADTYSYCRQLVTEKAQEFEKRKKELSQYMMRKLDELESCGDANPSPEQPAGAKKREEMLDSQDAKQRAKAKRDLFESEARSLDAEFSRYLQHDRVIDTEEKIADVRSLFDIVTSLANAFVYANDRMTREEEHIKAVAESICSVIELKPWGRKMSTIGERIKRTMYSGYQAFDESVVQIQAALSAIEAPRLLKAGQRGYT